MPLCAVSGQAVERSLGVAGRGEREVGGGAMIAFGRDAAAGLFDVGLRGEDEFGCGHGSGRFSRGDCGMGRAGYLGVGVVKWFVFSGEVFGIWCERERMAVWKRMRL